MNLARAAFLLGVLVLPSTMASCARPSGRPGDLVPASIPPADDSVTVALWHFDEVGGQKAADSGRQRLNGTAGLDTRTEFGRFRSARAFSSSIESWVFVPFAPGLNTSLFTIEAWLEPSELSNGELSLIAARWTEQPQEQSWLLALSGRQLVNVFTDPTAPAYFDRITFGISPSRLVFVYQPDDASPPRSFSSVSEVFLNRWTHVAVSIDGEVVRIYLNGVLDAQFAVRGGVRSGMAPLLVGNYFDTRRLSDFSGNLTTGGRIAHPPLYAFQGKIDELRLSNLGRTTFESVR
jgi:Concanavalin A-like lectin/glucanases superfamily